MSGNTIIELYVFVLAGFVGYMVITRCRRCCTRR